MTRGWISTIWTGRQPRSFTLIGYSVIVWIVDHLVVGMGRGRGGAPEGARVGAGSTAGRVLWGGWDGWRLVRRGAGLAGGSRRWPGRWTLASRVGS